VQKCVFFVGGKRRKYTDGKRMYTSLPWVEWERRLRREEPGQERIGLPPRFHLHRGGRPIFRRSKQDVDSPLVGIGRTERYPLSRSKVFMKSTKDSTAARGVGL